MEPLCEAHLQAFPSWIPLISQDCIVFVHVAWHVLCLLRTSSAKPVPYNAPESAEQIRDADLLAFLPGTTLVRNGHFPY